MDSGTYCLLLIVGKLEIAYLFIDLMKQNAVCSKDIHILKEKQLGYMTMYYV